MVKAFQDLVEHKEMIVFNDLWYHPILLNVSPIIYGEKKIQLSHDSKISQFSVVRAKMVCLPCFAQCWTIGN